MNDLIELYDVLDYKGDKTGIIRARKEVHTRGFFHKVVDTWIATKEGKLLLQLRDKTKETYPDRWDISSSGHVDLGETVGDAICREAMEEMGITLGANCYFHIGTGLDSFNYSDRNYHISELKEVNLYILTEEIPPEKFILREYETAGFKWLKAEEVMEGYKNSDSSYATMCEDTLKYYIPFFEDIIKILNDVKNKDVNKMKIETIKQEKLPIPELSFICP